VKVVLAPGVLDGLIRHARACLPEESCGFLVGRGDRADRFVPAENVLRSRTAFAVEPQFLFDFFRKLRRSGEELVAIVHSHPRTPAVPSEQDVASAYYPDCAQLIVSFRGPAPEVRGYRIADGQVAEIEVHAIV
jgi:proteasome lid subunit RPN8/RPN11